MLLIMVKSKSAYQRITQPLREGTFNPFLVSLPSLQRFLRDNPATETALVDQRLPEFEQVLALLKRLHIDYELFDGDFTIADQWLYQNMPSEPERVDVTLSEPMAQQEYDLSSAESKEDEESQISTEPHFESQSVSQNEGGELESSRLDIKRLDEPPADTPRNRTVEVATTLRPKLIVVTSLWPRAGSSFIASTLAYHLAHVVRYDGAVTLIEHPAIAPYYWTYFRLSENDKAKRSRHWLTGRNDPIELDKVHLIPLPEDYVPVEDANEAMLRYVYRELRRPFVILDLGSAIDDILIEMADELIVVLEADPVRLDSEANSKRYRTMLEQNANTMTFINKWTRYADLQGAFPRAVFLPYVSPEHVQRATWGAMFPNRIPEVHETIEHMLTYLDRKWIPHDMRIEESKKSFIPWRRNK